MLGIPLVPQQKMPIFLPSIYYRSKLKSKLINPFYQSLPNSKGEHAKETDFNEFMIQINFV